MKTPLVEVSIPSIYRNRAGMRVPVPGRMARATPDTAQALAGIGRDLESRGGRLVLSDLFRSHDMQLQAHLDWRSGKKKAFSPAPGGSLHESGRAFDISLEDLGPVSLADFWGIARAHGVVPIIKAPNAGASESWHFECRGSHQKVLDHYQRGAGSNMKPYAACSASAILAIGERVDAFGKRQPEAQLQASLIRAGHDIGNIDGEIGGRTRGALRDLGVADGDLASILVAVEAITQQTWLAEYRSATTPVLASMGFEATAEPDHLSLSA